MSNPQWEAWKDRVAAWRKDPAKMVREEFGVEPDRWQLRALTAFARQDQMRMRIALQACVGPGKTAVLAWMGLNFLACYAAAGRHPSGLCISISGDNLRDNLWKEFSVWRGRSQFFTALFELTGTRLFAREHPQTWFLAARSWPQKADVEAQGRSLSGLHSDFILYLIDESGDIPPAVLRSAEQGLSSCRWGRIIQGGNPTSHDGMLYHAATVQPHLWEIIRINGDPDDADRSPRIDIEWAAEQISLYGRSNPWVQAAILGIFPDASVNALLGPDEVATAMARELRPDQYNAIQKRIGIDVARFGDDATILAPRQGLAVFTMVEMRNARTQEIAARIIAGKQKFQSEMEFIDATGGHAAGTIDQCQLAGVNLFEVQFSGKADDPRYFNKRAEMAFRCAEAIKGGAALPKDAQLARELCATRYFFKAGKFQILEKDQIKKLLNGHSPDRADALWCTYAIEDLPARSIDGVEIPGFARPQAVSEWDPFEARDNKR